MYKPEEEWPIKQEVVTTPLPEESKTAMVAQVSDEKSIENLIDINDHSKYLKLINISGRLISVFRHKPTSGCLLESLGEGLLSLFNGSPKMAC